MLAQAATSANDLGPTAILILIAVLFGIFAMLKGLARLIFSLLGIVAGLAAGYFTWLNAASILKKLNVSAQEPWMPYALASVAAIGASFAFSSFIKTFFLKPTSHHGNSKFGFGAKAGLIGLLIGVLFVASGMTGLRYADAVAQLDRFRTALTTGSAESPSLVSRICAYLDNSRIGSLLRKADPVNDPDKVKAAKVLMMQSMMTPDSVETFMPLASGFVGGNSGVNAALAGSPEIRDSIAAEDYVAILQSDAVRELLKDPLVRKHIHELDLEVLINGDNGWRAQYE